MAWIEVRILATMLVYFFDFDMVDQHDWCKGQECYTLWEKPDQFVRVTPVQPKPPVTTL